MSDWFHEVRLPTDISQGATGGPRWSTSIATANSGREKRNQNWVNSRGEWDVSKGLQTPEQAQVLTDFFNVRHGRAIGFRFQWLADYRCPTWRNYPGDMGPIPVQFTTDGHTNVFQLNKYTDVGGTYVKPIYKTISATAQMLNNGVQSFDFVIDDSKGLVTLGDSTAATTGNLIALAFEFDWPVRFDTDDMKLSMTTTENLSWPNIPIVETREI